MRSKEEILAKANGLEKWEVSSYESQAMDEWAKECVAAFNEFKKDGEWVESKSRYGKWYTEKDGVELEYITFDELFNQFLQEIKQDK